MVLNFNYVKHEPCNCLDAMIMNVGNYYQVDVRLHYLKKFGFKYFKDILGELSMANPAVWFGIDMTEDLLADYCGIYLTIHKADKLLNNDIEEIIKSEIELQRPIGIFIDSYYLPWNSLHLQMHCDHYILIIGIEEDSYVCIDTFLVEERVFVKKNVLHDHVKSLYQFKYMQDKINSYTIQDVVILLKHYLNNNKKYHLENIRTFAHDILHLRYTNQEQIDFNRIGSSGLLYSFSNLAWSRLNFAQSLNAIMQKCQSNIFADDVILLHMIYEQWNNIKKLIIKSTFSDDKLSYLNRIHEILLDIANKEESIIENINRIKLSI